MDTRNKDPQAELPSLTGNYVFDDLLSSRERQFLVEARPAIESYFLQYISLGFSP